MRLLLDTHIALWAITDSPALPKSARRLIEDPSNTLIVSVVSLWEIGIKHRLGRRNAGTMPLSAEQARDRFDRAAYEIIPMTTAHTLEFERVPVIHADPFDRMLLAQARAERFAFLTHDATLARYGEPVILA